MAASFPVSSILVSYLSLIFLSFVANPSSAFSLGDSQQQESDTVDYIRDACPLLMAQVEQVLGTEHRRTAETRIRTLQDAMHPMFESLPKNANGELSAPTVRYMLHRFFRNSYGWLVKGLASTGDPWNSTLAVTVLQHEVSVRARILLEDHLQNEGFSLKEAACLGSALEEVVHAEALARLQVAYRLHGQALDKEASREQMEKVLDTYMTSYILQLAHVDPQILADDEVEELYPNWHSTQQFLRKTLTTIIPLTHKEISFADMAAVVREVSTKHGIWQNHECRELKQSLAALESECPGRVDIGDFQGGVDHGKWQFQESEAYLRDLHALDESVQVLPRVIVPNYITSSTNCIGTSKFFSTCCLDECEGILQKLEAKIAAPEAMPDLITEIVNGLLPSTPSSAGEELPEYLVRRLHEVAAQHKGSVPIYGRLFAQWMHHVWPLQCRFPFESSTLSPRIKFMSSASIASSQERRANEATTKRAHAGELAGTANLTKGDACIPWSPTEELLSPISYADPSKSVFASPALWAGVFMLASSFLACVSQLTTLQLPKRVIPGGKQLLTSDHCSDTQEI